MGSKLSPGSFDCYTNALPDEPMFVLLARDRLAPYLVRIWAAIRDADQLEAQEALAEALERLGAHYWASPEDDDGKIAEANQCARDMHSWRTENDGRWRQPIPATNDIPGQTGQLIEVDANGIATIVRGDAQEKQRLTLGVRAAFLGSDPRHPGRGVVAMVGGSIDPDGEIADSILFAMSPAGLEALADALNVSAQKIRSHSVIDMRQIV